MNKPTRPFIASATVAGLIVAAGLTAGAQTIIYSDNFNVPDNSSFDAATADSAGLSSRLSGLDGYGVVDPHSGGSQQSISGGQLQYNPTTSNHPEVRFNIAAQTGSTSPNLFDWSTGVGGVAITAAGGMTISFLLTTPTTTAADNWLSVCVGAGNSDISGIAPRVNNAGTSSGILFRDNGGTAIFHSGSENAAGEGAITPVGNTHDISITYDFTSWLAGSAVSMTAYEDGNLVGTDSFTWDYNYQYIDIGSQSPTADHALIDNFAISTVPEPTTWALVASGLGALIFARRFRRSVA